MKTAALAALLAPWASPSGGTENPGTTAAPVLQLPLGARACGMGTAYTALASDVSAMYYNPAGLSTLNHDEISFTYFKGLEDQHIEHVAAAFPVPAAGLIGNGFATLGAGLLFSQNGSIEVNRTRPDGSFLDTRNLNAGGDMVATLSFAERAMETTWQEGRRSVPVSHFVGLNAKFIRSTLAQSYSATAYAGDFGYLAKAEDLGFSAGLSLLNFGSRMTFVQEGDPLPLTARAGIGYLLSLDAFEIPPSQAIQFAADGDYSIREESWHANLGAEYSAMKTFSVRLGYQFRRDIAGLCVGFGLSWMDASLDYAWSLTDFLGDLHRVGLTYKFGRVEPRERLAPRRPSIDRMPERPRIENLEKKTPAFTDPPKRRPRPSPQDTPEGPGWIY
jgi:hypothetical protein